MRVCILLCTLYLSSSWLRVKIKKSQPNAVRSGPSQALLRGIEAEVLLASKESAGWKAALFEDIPRHTGLCLYS